MNHYQDYIPPVEETVAHKTDVLDWNRIAGQKCDLEYRRNFIVSLRGYCLMLQQFAVVSALAFPTGWIAGISIAPMLSSNLIGLVCVLSGAVWATASAWNESCLRNTDEIWPLLPGIIGRTCSPPIAWLAVVSTANLGSLSAAYLYLTAALPVAVVVFDRLATHAVHWNTANLLVSHAELTGGRAAWEDRLKSGLTENDGIGDDPTDSPVHNAVALRTYASGSLWLVASYTIPRALVALANSQPSAPTIGLELVYASFAGLFITAFYRIDGDFRVVLYFVRMLAHWFYHGAGARRPPWMFHSPCGGYRRRRALLLLVVALLSLHSTSMAAHSFRAIPISGDEAVDMQRHDTDRPASSVDISNDLLGRTLWIAPTVLFALCVPFLEFLLVGLILIGPILSTYHRQFE